MADSLLVANGSSDPLVSNIISWFECMHLNMGMGSMTTLMDVMASGREVIVKCPSWWKFCMAAGAKISRSRCVNRFVSAGGVYVTLNLYDRIWKLCWWRLWPKHYIVMHLNCWFYSLRTSRMVIPFEWHCKTANSANCEPDGYFNEILGVE